MVEFGSYLLEHIVPEWRDKYIDYENLKQIIESIQSSGSSTALTSTNRFVEFYDDIESQERFRRFSTLDMDEMVPADKDDIEDYLLDSHSYYSSTSSTISTDLVVELLNDNNTWENEKGELNFQFILPKGDGCSLPYERLFFSKLAEDLSMVNQWYIEKLSDCREKIEMYEKQIDHYCELNGQPSSFTLFQSQTYRQLEFGLKELYRLVGFLKNYCVLNKQAVDKILKKHDKNSYFSSRGTINTAISHLSFFRQRDLSELLGTVENTWRKFTGKQSITNLRTSTNNQPALYGFGIGINTGASIVLLVSLVLTIIHKPLPFTPEQQKTIWCYFRLQIFFILQLWMWGFDVLVFQRFKINYEYIFGKYKPYLTHTLDQFLIASTYTVIVLIVLNLWYYFAFTQKVLSQEQITYIFPISLILLILQIIPIPGLYFKYRWYMLRHCVKLFFVLFYEMRFPDFFLGDQFTSHVQTFYDLVHVIINVCTRSYLTLHDKMQDFSPLTILIIRMVILVLPNFIRLIQNLRRFFLTGDLHPNIYNGIKYFLGIIASLCSELPIPYAIMQTIYTCYAVYWDIHEDWSLFHCEDCKSKWWGLRKKSLIPYPFLYYLAIVNNVILRFAWTWKPLLKKSLNPEIVSLIFGCIDIFRRNIWNIFRMENEQVNNCGKFRADLDVPIPFSDF